MGILSVDSVTVPAPAAPAPGAPQPPPDPHAPKKESTPTFLSGESLTFPLITGVGTAAITLVAAARDTEPDVRLVVIVAIICGIIVTIWGYIDAAAAQPGKPAPGKADLFKQLVIGALNTVLLASALWGTVAVAQAAYATGT